jgi:transcriptional regulator with XRE-family HTH domain
MNEKLKVARLKKGWSQEDAAYAVQVAPRTYQRWENGETHPNFESRKLLREAFGATDEELGLLLPDMPVATAPKPELQKEPRRDLVQNELSPVPTNGQVVILTQEQVAALYDLLGLGDKNMKSTRANFDPRKRETLQKLLQLLKIAGITIGGFQLLDLDQFERLAGALKKPSRIDTKTLNGLKNTTANYWQVRLYGSVASPDLLNATKEHHRIVIQLLQGSLFPTIRASLSAVASETALLAGMLLATDMHQPAEAKSYYTSAFEVAQQASNDALYAAVLGRMGALAAASDTPQEACTFLREAQRSLTQSSTFTLRSWLVAEEAEVQAEIAAQESRQSTSACFKALERAEAFAGHIGSEEETFGMYFDGARIPAYRGSCNIRLHRPEEALLALNEALEPLEPSGALTRAVLLDLAEASIQATAIEQACSYITQTLDIITQMQTRSSLQRVFKLRQQLQPWAEVPTVKDLDEQLSRLKLDIEEGW